MIIGGTHMINVIQVNKTGRRIVEYICKDGRKKLHICKEELSKLITEGKVSNAKTQTYKGTIIIRLQDGVTVCQIEDNNKHKNKENKKVKNTVIKLKSTEDTKENKRTSGRGIKGGVADIEELSNQGNSMEAVFQNL